MSSMRTQIRDTKHIYKFAHSFPTSDDYFIPSFHLRVYKNLIQGQLPSNIIWTRVSFCF